MFPQFLAVQSVPPSYPSPLKSSLRTTGGDTALIWAVRTKNMDLIINAIEVKGLPVDEQNYEGETSLFVAVLMDWVECVSYLIEKGANPNIARNIDGVYPLHVAVANGNFNMLDLLIREGSWLDVTDGSGETPLHYAVREEFMGALEHLLMNGANAHHLNEDSETPLELAKTVASNEVIRCFEMFFSTDDSMAMDGDVMGALSGSLNKSLRLLTSSDESMVCEEEEWSKTAVTLGSSLGQDGSAPQLASGPISVVQRVNSKTFLPQCQTLFQLNTGKRILV